MRSLFSLFVSSVAWFWHYAFRPCQPNPTLAECFQLVDIFTNDMNLSKEETMERLCRLMNQVNAKLTGHSKAADCFCGANKSSLSYQNDSDAVMFIEAAITKALEKL